MSIQPQANDWMEIMLIIILLSAICQIPTFKITMAHDLSSLTDIVKFGLNIRPIVITRGQLSARSFEKVV
jgi:hypothetical protein